MRVTLHRVPKVLFCLAHMWAAAASPLSSEKSLGSRRRRRLYRSLCSIVGEEEAILCVRRSAAASIRVCVFVRK